MSKLKGTMIFGVITILAFGLIISGLGNVSGRTLSPNQEIQQTSEYKYKTAYLHNESASVLGTNYQYTFNNTKGNNTRVTDWISGDSSYQWTMTPTLASELTVGGNTTFYIWASQKNAENYDDTSIQFDVSISELSGAGSTTVAQNTKSYNVRSSFTEYSIDLNFNNTFNKGNSIQIDLSMSHPANRDHRIAYGSDSYPSRLEMRTKDYAHPSLVNSFNSTYQETDVYNDTANNKTAYINTTISDPFGRYDIWAVNITILDENDNIVKSIYRDPMDHISGNHTSYKSNYSYEWNYSGLDPGKYTAIVSVVDLTGYYYRYPEHPGDETYGGHIEKLEYDFWIGGRPYFVNFQTVDSMGNKLDGARIKVGNETGITDNEGLNNFTSLYSGTYSITVHWQDIEVSVDPSSYPVTENISEENPVVIQCGVYYPSYQVLDSNGDPVDNARIFISHPNGSLFNRSTDSTGTINLNQVPEGIYELTTYWRGKEVNYTVKSVNDNSTDIIHGRIYSLDVTTVDNQGEVVSDVQVTIRFEDTQRIADSKLTDHKGMISVQLPGTESGFSYEINCRWHGINIGKSTNVQLTGNKDVTISLDIYVVDFQTLDDTGDVLEYTSLNAFTNQTGDLANSIKTDVNGLGSMKLPRGKHTVEAYWKGVYVGRQSINVTSGLSTQDIYCNVYHVTYNLVDSRKQSLEGAGVKVSYGNVGILSTGTTDSNGDISTRLPGVEVDILAEWKGITVFDDTQMIDANEEITLECTVYYLTIHVEDDIGESLEDAEIQVKKGNEILAYSTSDDQGTTSEMRLPSSVYTINAQWKGIQVYSQNYNLLGNTTHTINVNVYHLDIRVEDNLSEKISGAKVSILHDGSLLNSGVTDQEGIFKTRAPIGSHEFTVSWREVVVYRSGKQVYETGNITLHSDDVYHVTFHLIDSRDASVSNASISLNVNSNQFSSGTSNRTGRYEERIPTPVNSPGYIKTTIYWKDVLVYDQNVQVSQNAFYEDSKELDLHVYYVDLTLEDYRGKPVTNAKITDSHSELAKGESIIGDQNTDAHGKTIFRLPRGKQTFTATWKDIQVNSTEFTLDGDKTFDLDASIYYLDITILDDKGKSLPHSQVRVLYPDSTKLYQSNYTDEQGRIEVRVPASTWDIEASWFDTVIHEQEYNVTSSEKSWSLTAEVDVYYLTLKTIDKDGKKLSDVHLTVKGNGKSWSGYSKNGNITFKLPSGDYQVKAEFKDTYLLTKVDLDKNKDVNVDSTTQEKIKFSKYPQPVYTTNLFFISFILLIILVIIAYVYKNFSEKELEEDIKKDREEEEDYLEEDTAETDEEMVQNDNAISGEDDLDEEFEEEYE